MLACNALVITSEGFRAIGTPNWEGVQCIFENKQMLPLWSFAAWERKGFLQRMIENARNLSRSCDKEEKYRLQVLQDRKISVNLHMGVCRP